MTSPRSVAELTALLAALPSGTTFSIEAVRALIAQVAPADGVRAPVLPDRLPSPDIAPTSWREKLWTCPPETRLGVCELAEALGRPKSYVYRLTSVVGARQGRTIPHRKIDSELVFVAHEVRAWLCETEEVVVEGAPAPLADVWPMAGRRYPRSQEGR